MDKEILNKIKISTYHGTFEEEDGNEKKVLAGYGSNKAHVIAKTKRLAKQYSKEHPDKNIIWVVFLNTSMKDVIDEGVYYNGKISK